MLRTRNIATEKDGILVLAHRDRTEVAHAVVAHHGARDAGSLLDVTVSAVAEIAGDEFLGDAAAHRHGDFVEQTLLRTREDILGGKIGGAAKALAARNNGNLVHRHGAVIEHTLHDRVAGLVPGNKALFGIVHHAAAFAAPQDLVARLIDVGHLDLLLVAASGQQRGFVEQIRQLSAGKARRAARDHGEVDIVGESNLAGVNAQDLLAADDVGKIDVNLAVKAARAQQRGVQYVRTIRRGDDDDTFLRVEAVHLDEQRIERLFALVIATTEAGAALAADGVDFVNEDQARGVLAALLEHVAHAAGAHADEHFHEVRTADGEERHVSFAGDCLREQRLAGTRDRKSTRLNSSHSQISYAVFCL